jgi:hypothetical protein
MRDLNMWAYQRNDFGSVCENARLDNSSGLKYPAGSKQGQAGWDVAVPYNSLDELAKKLTLGIAMPKEYCGKWLGKCDPVERGELGRLAIMAHGEQGGQFAVNGKLSDKILKAETVEDSRNALQTIGLYTRADATILLVGCLAGQGKEGTALLKALSAIWAGRIVVGFSMLGYRYGGEMKRVGEGCVMPGMRDTDAPADIYATPPKWDKLWGDFDKLPWASESSINAKVVRNGIVERCPPNELCRDDVMKPKTAPPKSPLKKPGLPLPTKTR